MRAMILDVVGRIGLFVVLVLGCGTNGDPSAADTSGATDSPAATGGQATTSHDVPSDADSNDAEASTAEPEPLPTDTCPEVDPVEVPLPALGCEPMMLLDENDLPTRNPSGVVICGASLYRTARVPCPTGGEGECTCDAQCDESEVCLCADQAIGTTNRCMFADCGTADDCAEGDCRFEENGCGFVALRCSSPSDECVSDGDCFRGGTCTYDEVDEMFTCDGGGCIAE